MSLPISRKEYATILRNDFPSFIHRAFYELNPQTRFIPGPHIELIASRLEACRRGEIRRLIINLPPRNLKSHCASIAFPAWLLGHNPSSRITCVSYGQDLAEKLARDTRHLMYTPWYQRVFPTRIGDRQALHDFETTEKGFRRATSVGGVLTGTGADFIILDDPQKPDEALSETQRNSTNQWFDNTLFSRLNDKGTGCIIIVMQRLHQEDLVGHVLEKDAWETLSFPAIAESDSGLLIEGALGRKRFSRREGEALHPQREPLTVLESIRRQVGDYNFSSQYQQSPTPEGGAIVKSDWLRYFDEGSEPARFGYTIQSWDTANKAGELNDYSVCTTWGVLQKDIHLLDVFRRRLNFPDLKRAVIELQRRFRAHRVLIEDKASGTQLIQELRGQCGHITAYMPPSGADKIMRLHAQTTFFENGRVRIKKDAPWTREYIAELTGFPGTKYDDQVDSTTQFLDHIRSRGTPLVITEETLDRAAMPWRRDLLAPCSYPAFRRY